MPVLSRMIAGRVAAVIPAAAFAAALAAALGACARPPAATPPAPAPTPTHPAPSPLVASVARAPVPPPNPKLPSVPTVIGPLDVRVVYPKPDALVAARDSSFVIGSVGNGNAGLRINGTLVPVWPNGAFLGWVPVPPASNPVFALEAYTERDTVRLQHRVRTLVGVPPMPPVAPVITPVSPARAAVLGNDSLERAVSDTDRVIIGRPSPTGTYRWFLFPGTTVWVTEYRNGMAHVQLDADQDAWIATSDLRVVDDTAVASAKPSAKTAPAKTAAAKPVAARPMLRAQREARVVPSADWIDVQIPVAAPPAYLVEEAERRITLTLYNTTADPDFALPASSDPYLTDAYASVDAPRLTLKFELSRPAYGYLVLYDKGMLTFRIRRPPMVNATRPLERRVIAIDAGHPPAGATGPTGLYEPEATLAVAQRVRELLEARGATVIMTRTTSAAVALGDRPIMARRANAEALVSIHLNALPDGRNPLRENGTSTYYFQPHAKRFATFVQDALVPELGLRDLGVIRENLALARPTWMPSVLAEGLFVILPDQEAAIRTPEYQAAYARGIVTGLERFFATFAQ